MVKEEDKMSKIKEIKEDRGKIRNKYDKRDQKRKY